MIRLLCALLLATTLFAHPHIFVETRVDIQPEKTWILWTFDEMTSSMLMTDYDKNKDKKLDANEVAFMRKDHFETLGPYSYFVRLFDGNDESDTKTILDFTASYTNNKVMYLMSIPTSQLKNYELHFYDGEMYVAMIVKPSYLTCAKEFKCKVEGYDADFYYGYKVMVSH